MSLILGLQISCSPQISRASLPASTPILEASPAGVSLYRGDALRSGVYPGPAIRHLPQVKWQTKISSTWLMPPMLSEGILFTGSGDGTLYALDAETGTELWTAGGFDQLETTGAISDGLIVTGGYNSQVRAVDVHSGETVWSFGTGYPVQGSPLIHESRVFVATDHAVHALDLHSGKLIWTVPTGHEGAYMGAPAYSDGVIYTTGGRLLLALDSETGELLWRVEKSQPFLGLAVDDRFIYVGNWDRNLYAFDRSTGEEQWKFQAGGEFWSAPAVLGGRVYSGNIDGYIYALEVQTGEKLWSFRLSGRSPSDPVIADGILYVSDSSHEESQGPRHLYALDAHTGEQVWVFETISTFLPAPALGAGRLYITSTGEVLALE